VKPLLARENGELLAQLAWSRLLVAFDFDGTLAPIVTDRHAARMQPETSVLLEEVCKRYPCAVISGRSQADVSEKLKDAHVKYVVGNHGLEPGADLREFEAEIVEVRRLLEGLLGDTAGIDLEDKRYSLAVHYRRSRNKRLARAAIDAALSALPMRMRAVAGKLVINVVSERAPNKGQALQELRRIEDADTAIYVGDDVTDEDVFRLDQPGRLVGVRIGRSRLSMASYFLRDQKQIDRLLERLVDLRSEVPRSC
jgi:trehalose 6-phosphate phosphatase